MSKETKAEMMQGVAAVRSKLVANNTVEYFRENGERVIRLHQTDVVTFSPDGRTVTLNTGSWKTLTTKDRINQYSPQKVWSDRGVWYIGSSWNTPKNERCRFYDGMKIVDGKLPKPNEAVAKREDKLAKQITAFVNKLDKLDAMPLPENGDCWGCAMVAEDGSHPMGKDCVLGHIKEGYLHGSLIYRAMQSRGYGNVNFVFNMRARTWPSQRTEVKRDLRRFLKKEAGLVA
jgi:hypothetical protein